MDTPVIIMIVLVVKSACEEPLFADVPGNDGSHSIIGVILEIKELIIGIVSAKLIVQAEENAVMNVPSDFIIYCIEIVFAVFQTRIAFRISRLKFSITVMMKNIGRLVIKFIFDQIMLEAYFDIIGIVIGKRRVLAPEKGKPVS